MLIQNENKKWHFDFALLAIVLLLCGLGLLNLYSATSELGSGDHAYFFSHLRKIILGLCIMVGLTIFHYRIVKSWAFLFYVFSILLLIAVFFWGVERGGQKNWLDLGITLIQPGELAKLACIVMLAFYFERFPLTQTQTLKELLKPLLIIFIPVLLLMLEGDLGNTLFFLIIGAGMFWLAGLRKKYFVIAFLAVLVFSPLAYKLILSTHHKQRIHAFLHPEDDPRGKGYHLLQSKIAVGSGKVWGKGYQKGYFSRLKYVPERYTDFVFAVFAEEWGLVGSAFLIIIFALFLVLLIRHLSQLRDDFAILIVCGVTVWIFAQIALNLGGVLGIMPLAGVTLPFFSYGGSSLLTVFIALGLVLNIKMRRYVF